ncbi:unnamed protein product [Victoria cruziana]
MTGNGEEEPEKKRRGLNSVSDMAKKELSPPSPENKAVDAVVLQYQNQRLVQQLEAQKSEVHVLEAKFNELKAKQVVYDEALIGVNKIWNLLVDDLILLGLRAGDYENGVQKLGQLDNSAGIPLSFPLEETFLFRLLEANGAESDMENGTASNIQMSSIKEALASRRASTLSLMKGMMQAVDIQWLETERLASMFHGGLSAEDAVIELQKLEVALTIEIKNLQEVIDILNLKHKDHQEEIKTYLESHAADQHDIKCLADELEESMAELEESRRKLVNLKVQNVACGTHIPLLSPVNGVHSFEKSTDRSGGMRELKVSLEEAKILAARRLSELQEICEENAVLSKQLKTLQNEMKDEKYVTSSRPYTTFSEWVQHLKSDLEKYKGLIDSLQAERNNLSWKEKELNAKAETADASREVLSDAESRIQELETQLQRCMADKNDLELKLEEAGEDSGKKDIKSEFSVMAEALSKELGVMEVQLNRFKDIACEALPLREEVRYLKEKIDQRMGECKTLSDEYAANVIEIKSFKALIERLQKEKQTLQIFLDMYGQESFEKRDIMDIKESEHRAHMQAGMLKSDLDEHSLELRVRAANEAETTCQQRLSAAEAEISDLRDELDTIQRRILEVKEVIKVKDEEAEAYISEIETIGQAYEDMQMQNRRLQHQVAERDDYNIKLVSESMKVKHAQSSLITEKQALVKQLQQANASLDFLKMRIARGEEQIKVYLAQAAKASQENRHLAISVENTKVDQADVEKELKWLKTAVECSDKDIEHNQKKFDELRAELEKERLENERLQEEVQKLRNQVEQMASESSEAAIEKLQEKIKDYKAVLKCSVCYERPKEVVITKCNHLFCSLCIQRNLEIRHRKCPGCGTAFGQNDVRTVHI